ncbi:MAG TPA: manganese-dependent inorganic pyrophosphatase, partial [Fusobacteriaceae bacterium]|nr:manganese-dependent inorganic pyrophosphatase [Fusobacteriaceae bacterium]
MKEKILIFGHKNPDTDSICSAIAYSNLKDQLGLNTTAVRLGELNKETEFILDY